MAFKPANFLLAIPLVLMSTICCWSQTLETMPIPVESHGFKNSTGVNSLEKYKYTEVRDVSDLNCSSFVMEEEYILLENGSLIVPGDDTVHQSDGYYLRNNTAYICASDNEPSATSKAHSPYSREFLACGHVLLDNEEYKLLQNGSVYIGIYNKMYESSDYHVVPNGVYVCLPRYKEMQSNMNVSSYSSEELDKFSEGLAYVTYIGISLSIVSLLLHLVVFCVVSSVRNLPGCCLASLSLSLLVAYLCFLSAPLVETSQSCASLGLCIYYFFLSSFFWMNAIAFDVWRSFRVVVRELRISSHRIPRRRFFLYSLYSWLTPALLALFVKMADVTDLLPDEFKPSFGAPICWFGKRKPLLVFFAAPLFAVMLLNGIFFLDVTYVISRATMKTSQSHEATLKRRFFMFTRLALIMGLTWVVGIVAGYADNEVLWYLFVVLNTLQGLFIFVVFSCSSKVRSTCCDKFKKRSRNMTSTSVRTISQASGPV